MQVYHSDSLVLTRWSSQSPIPPVRQPLGVDLEQRLLYTLDAKGRLTVVDLDSRGVRQQLSALLAYPSYYRHMAPINRAGPRVLRGSFAKPAGLPPYEFERRMEAGAWAVGLGASLGTVAGVGTNEVERRCRGALAAAATG